MSSCYTDTCNLDSVPVAVRREDERDFISFYGISFHAWWYLSLPAQRRAISRSEEGKITHSVRSQACKTILYWDLRTFFLSQSLPLGQAAGLWHVVKSLVFLRWNISQICCTTSFKAFCPSQDSSILQAKHKQVAQMIPQAKGRKFFG